jgi:hypothetical protein
MIDRIVRHLGTVGDDTTTINQTIIEVAGDFQTQIDLINTTITTILGDISTITTTIGGLIDEVIAGTNLSGGGTSGSVTLNVIDSPIFAGSVTVAGTTDTGAFRGGVQTVTTTGVYTLVLDPDVTHVRFNLGADAFVVGMTGGTDGRVVFIENMSSAYSVYFYDEHASATTPADRFALESDAGATNRLMFGGGKAIASYNATLLTGRWSYAQLLGLSSPSAFQAFGNISTQNHISASGRLSGGVYRRTVYPAQTLIGSVNNWDPSGAGFPLYAFSEVPIQAAPVGTTDITGFDDTYALNGDSLVFVNRSGQVLRFPNNSASSTLSKRWINPSGLDAYVPDGGSITYLRENTQWRLDSVATTYSLIGSGTLNTVPKWTPDGFHLGNSRITDDATNVRIASTAGDTLILTYTGTGQTADRATLDVSNAVAYADAPHITYGVKSTVTAAGGPIDSVGMTSVAYYANAAIAAGNGGTAYSFLGAAGLMYNAGNLQIDGNATLGNAAGDAHSLRGSLNANLTAGAPGEILAIVGGLPSWASSSSLGLTTGTGTTNKVAKWTSATALGDSGITDDGTTITLNSGAGGIVLGGVGDTTTVTAQMGVRIAPGGAAAVYVDGTALTYAVLGIGEIRGTRITAGVGAGAQAIVQWIQAGQTTWQAYEPASSNELRFWNSVAGDILTLTNAGDVTTTNALTVTTNLAVNGNATLGNASTDSHLINGILTVQDLRGTVQTSTATGTLDLTLNATTTVIRFNSASQVDWIGLSGGTDGRVVFVQNYGAGNVFVYQEHVTPAAAARFKVDANTGSRLIVNTAGTAILVYNGAASRWQMYETSAYNRSGGSFLGDVSVVGNLSATGNLSGSGNCTLGDASTDTHTLNGNITFSNPPTAGSIKYGALQARIWIKRQVFTSTGTYTPSSGCKAVRLRMVGCGGGGGGSTATAGNVSASAGGGSGVYLEHWIEPGVDITGSGVNGIVIGTAGAAGAAAGGSGGTGGDCSALVHGTTYTAKGGTGGAGANNSGALRIFAGGAPQSGSSAVDFTAGGGGTCGITVANATNAVQIGNGGNNPLGTGGQGAAGLAARGYGSGGRGQQAVSASVAGEAGLVGVVIIEEYA